MKKKAAFYTLGCKVNTFDTEALMEIFKSADYEIVPFEESADIYIVNTCTVTPTGDQKSRNMLRRAKRNNPEAIVIAAGCYAQVAAKELESMPEVDIVLGTQNRLKILDYIESYKQTHNSDYVYDNFKSREFEALTVSEKHEKTRAYIKVQEGCDQFCSYCIVPYARGRVRSRALDSVIAEAEKLVCSGFSEFVITGIHVASYGKEWNNDTDLLTLIRELDLIKGVERIRLSSIEPTYLTEKIISALSAIPSFCPHFHLSLQSGSDTVLERMNRKYTTDQYLQVVQNIRHYFKHPAITTDIMVGFPGETETEFSETCDFIQKVRFYQIHVFKYSRRKGTVADTMPNQVDETVKKERSQKLIAISKELETAFLQENDKTTAKVLFEQEHDFSKNDSINNKINQTMIVGHTMNYIPVYLNADKNNCGKIIEVKLSYNKNQNLMIGKII